MPACRILRPAADHGVHECEGSGDPPRPGQAPGRTAAGHGALAGICGAGAGAKAAAVATGVVIAGSVATGAVVLTQHHPKKAKPAPVRIERVSYDQRISGLDLRDARYAHAASGTRPCAFSP